MKKYIVLILLLLNGCASIPTGHFCYFEKQLMYEIPLGKQEVPQTKHWWDCYRKVWEVQDETERVGSH